MNIQHRHIPILPERPHVHPIPGQITRSYPVGRQNFSRICQGEMLELSISSDTHFPKETQINLLTTLNAKDGKKWSKLPFWRKDDSNYVCQIQPEYPGLHSFRLEFSLNKGAIWLRDNVPDAWVLVDPPQVDALRLYTLIPNVSGNLDDWKADLKHIKEMGFNAIHLMPITAMDTSESPYAAKNLFDIDISYLIKNDLGDNLSQLSEFVEAAKVLSIRLCFDLVLNHVGVNSKITKHAPDWIIQDDNQPDGLQRAKYWDGQSWKNWNDLVLINYEHPSEEIRSEIWAYMTDYALFWAKYASYTGGFVRFDNLHSSDPHFVESMTTALHAEFPEVGILAEYFADESTLLRTGPQWGLNLNLATPWNCKFVPQLREYINYIHRISKHIRYFMPITSHDSGSPAQEFGSADSTVPRYAVAALLGTGATGMPQGVEYGESERINFIGRRPKTKYPAEARFGLFIGKVHAILAEYAAFRCGENCHFIDNGHNAVIAAFRHDTTNQYGGFLIICNFDTQFYQSISIDLEPVLGKEVPILFVDLLSGNSSQFKQTFNEFQLEPCSAKIFKFSATTSVDF